MTSVEPYDPPSPTQPPRRASLAESTVLSLTPFLTAVAPGSGALVTAASLYVVKRGKPLVVLAD